MTRFRAAGRRVTAWTTGDLTVFYAPNEHHPVNVYYVHPFIHIYIYYISTDVKNYNVSEVRCFGEIFRQVSAHGLLKLYLQTTRKMVLYRIGGIFFIVVCPPSKKKYAIRYMRNNIVIDVRTRVQTVRTRHCSRKSNAMYRWPKSSLARLCRLVLYDR